MPSIRCVGQPTIRDVVAERAIQIGRWRGASHKLTGGVLLLPFVVVSNHHGLLWGVTFAIVIGIAIVTTLDAFLFAGRIRCPVCQGRLWKCLKNGPRGRRLLLREDVAKCPWCGVDFSQQLQTDGRGGLTDHMNDA